MGSEAACADAELGAAGLTFDAEKHEYRIDGQRVPSVTQVLQGAGLIDTRWFNEEARTRGTYVAQATQFYDEGTLDYDALDDELKSYIMAWEKFLVENDVQVVNVEMMVANLARRYAGTLDRLIILREQRWLLDIKTGSKAAWHALQTAGYSMCIVGPIGWHHRASILLQDDGSYMFHKHGEPSDRDVFLSALNLYHWKSEKGLLNDRIR